MRSSICGFMAGVVAACAFTLPASAQTVYRCGPDGRSYSQQACDDGKPVRVGDARSEAQRREAEQTASRDARIARRLEGERLAVRPASAGARIDGRGSPAAEPVTARPSAMKKRRKALPDEAREAGFRAAVPKPAKTKSAAASG